MRATNGHRSRVDVCFPRALLLNEIYRYLRATVIGPVETVHRGGSSLAGGHGRVLAACGWCDDKFGVSGDAFVVGDRAGRDSAVDSCLCTGRCTGRCCDGCEHSDGSFLEFSRQVEMRGGMDVPRDARMTGRRSALGALPDPGGELFDVIEDLATLGHLSANLLLRVHDRGVVSPERLADLGQ